MGARRLTAQPDLDDGLVRLSNDVLDHPAHGRVLFVESRYLGVAVTIEALDHTDTRPDEEGAPRVDRAGRGLPGPCVTGKFYMTPLCRCGAHHAPKLATSTSVAAAAMIQPPRILLPRAEVDAMQCEQLRIRTILRRIGACVHIRPRRLTFPLDATAAGGITAERCNLWRRAVTALTQINPVALSRCVHLVAVAMPLVCLCRTDLSNGRLALTPILAARLASADIALSLVVPGLLLTPQRRRALS